jgi:Zn-dependent protease
MGLFVSGIVAVALHEIAHLAMASALGVRIHQVGISWKGPFLRRAPGNNVQNLAITLAGPGINVLLGVLLHHIHPGFALSNLVLGLFNLLPIPHSDGARALGIVAAIRKMSSGSPIPSKAPDSRDSAGSAAHTWRQAA